jgi:hypothetical protein
MRAEHLAQAYSYAAQVVNAGRVSHTMLFNEAGREILIRIVYRSSGLARQQLGRSSHQATPE